MKVKRSITTVDRLKEYIIMAPFAKKVKVRIEQEKVKINQKAEEMNEE